MEETQTTKRNATKKLRPAPATSTPSRLLSFICGRTTCAHSSPPPRNNLPLGKTLIKFKPPTTKNNSHPHSQSAAPSSPCKSKQRVAHSRTQTGATKRNNSRTKHRRKASSHSSTKSHPPTQLNLILQWFRSPQIS